MSAETKALKVKIDEMRKLYLESHNEEVLSEWRRASRELREIMPKKRKTTKNDSSRL